MVPSVLQTAAPSVRCALQAPRPAWAATLRPTAAPRQQFCRRLQRSPWRLASDAASMPAPDSSSSSNGASQPVDAVPDASGNGAAASPAEQQAAVAGGFFGWLRAQQARSAELRKKLASLGLAAVLAYGERGVHLGLLGLCVAKGAMVAAQVTQECCNRCPDCAHPLRSPLPFPAPGLFDGVSYTIAFSLAFLGYEARTGLNPTANVADLIKICVLM